MKFKLTSVYVEDRHRALRRHTDVLDLTHLVPVCAHAPAACPCFAKEGCR